MKILIYSDVHGNLPAFEKMLKIEYDCEKHICLGDLVNYGPWSNECVDLAKSLANPVFIMGNHEEAFIDGFYPGNNEMVKQFFEITSKSFNRMDDIKRFTAEYTLENYLCRHTIFDQYIYPDTTVLLNNNYIIGHSHHQFKYTNNDFTLYNAGSVGQNRKYINVINYLIYDTSSQLIEMKNLEYNVDLVINEMKSLKYPEVCINYYIDKKCLNG
jgi:predicted phosphodiesterase